MDSSFFEPQAWSNGPFPPPSKFPFGANKHGDLPASAEDVDEELQDICWTGFYPPTFLAPRALPGLTLGYGRKRTREESLDPNLYNFFFDNGLLPSVPAVDQRVVDVIANPFIPSGVDSTGYVVFHPASSTKRTQVVIPDDGRVDGLIKVRLWKEHRRAKQKSTLLERLPLRFQQNSHQQSQPVQIATQNPTQDVVEEINPTRPDPSSQAVTTLPTSFGRPPNLDSTDNKLFFFYVIAVCSGRTVIESSNLYLHQFAAMVASDECVKHAVLSLAASYVLDFEWNEKLLARANLHQKRSVHLIGKALNDLETYSPGKEDAVLAAIVILAHNEGVNLGAEATFDPMPPWWKAMKTAEDLLCVSDPGYKYANPTNVQSSRARFEIANRVGLFAILSRTVAPIERVAEKCDYPWLLHGTERELRKIIGTTGFCSRLMHIFAQITHLTSRYQKNPESTIIPAAGKVLASRLHNFHQWSDLSEGHPTSAKLLSSCVLGPDGRVHTSREATELIAESYAAAAQVYLHCRLFKKPRAHPDVQEPLSRLMKCLAWTPVSGPLFTAQAPLHTAFLGALVAYSDEDREVARCWFETIIAICRGNVVKPWRVVQHIWDWLDTGYGDRAEGYNESLRKGWWEDMVQEIFNTEGRLDLA